MSPHAHFRLRGLVCLCLLTVLPGSCAAPLAGPTPLPPTPTRPEPAFTSGQYPNLFKDLLGKTDAEVQAKIEAAWEQLFYGNDQTERVYYPVGPDMAYITDIGNGDVRTEGMSYGLMLAVQLDKPEEFNRLWRWAKTYMYQAEGPYAGYFAWHCAPDGAKLDQGPAPDGEEWFVTALFFAAARWGNGAGLFHYTAEAQALLDRMLHKNDEANGLVTSMFNADSHMIVFVPKGQHYTYTDPSYHLPAYYELWARWADKDQAYWAEAAQVSRAFWKTAAHPQTGLMPDYANFDGSPYTRSADHQDFRFDAFRNAANVAVDYVWFAADPWAVTQSDRLLEFFYAQGMNQYVNQYTLAGEPLSTDRSPGLIAMNATAALAATTAKRQAFVQALWDTRLPTGKWRYYDGLLYFLALLQVSGNFRIYAPTP